jgi:membrane-associated phospholipid phosphatase
MLAARRHEKKLFQLFIPVAAGIVISLVYCRYHYVMDIIAGFALAGSVNGLARRLHQRLGAVCAPHFGAGGKGP